MFNHTLLIYVTVLIITIYILTGLTVLIYKVFNMMKNIMVIKHYDEIEDFIDRYIHSFIKNEFSLEIFKVNQNNKLIINEEMYEKLKVRIVTEVVSYLSDRTMESLALYIPKHKTYDYIAYKINKYLKVEVMKFNESIFDKKKK